MTSKLKARINSYNTNPTTYELKLTACFNLLGLIWPMTQEDIEELRDQLSEFLRIKVSDRDLGEALPEMLKQQAE